MAMRGMRVHHYHQQQAMGSAPSTHTVQRMRLQEKAKPVLWCSKPAYLRT